MEFPHDVPGWLRQPEGELLAELARGRVVLEIGSYHGRSTVCMARTARFVYALDWGRGDAGAGSTPSTAALLATLVRFQCENVAVLVGRSEDVGPVLAAGAFDMAFVDGAHDYDSVRRDLELVKRVVRPGGVVALHDWQYATVLAATADVLGWRADDGEGLTLDTGGNRMHARALS